MTSISRLLSHRRSDEPIAGSTERDPDVIPIADEAADEVFSALSSTTARSVLAALHERPRTASEIAADVDTSLQNANYHLDKLGQSGLVNVAGTRYSDQGKEMKVYAPTNRALVLFVGDDLQRPTLLEVLKRLVGFVSLFALASFAVEELANSVSPDTSYSFASAGDAGGQTGVVLQPGMLFFLGSVLALLAFGTWWYYRSR